VNATLVDEQLSADMAMVQRVTSLGHAARQNANLKVRQPLAQVVVRTRTNEEEAALRRLQQFVLDELNVKALGFTHAGSDLVDVTVFPYPKQLGQKYGKGYPKIRQAMAAMDQLELAGKLPGGRDGGDRATAAEGERYAVAPEDVEVRMTPRAGFSVAQDRRLPGGRHDGAGPGAACRKAMPASWCAASSNCARTPTWQISDRIVTYIADSDLMHAVLAHFGDYVRDETLSVDLVQIHPGDGGSLPAHLPSATFELGDRPVTVAIGKK
jgi:isoleucyl-tRNA synthetase